MQASKSKRRLRINQEAVRNLRAALKAAKRERCGSDQEHQEAMRIYLDTWVVAPLETALAIIEGKPVEK